MKSRESLGFLLGLIGVLIFAGTLPATRIAVQGFDPWFIGIGRSAVAGLVALALVLVMRWKPPVREDWGKVAVAGLCVCILFPGLTCVAMVSVPAAHGGVVLGAMPLATAMISSAMSGERLSLAYWACAIGGAAIVMAFALADGGAGGFAWGDLALAAAVPAAGLGYTMLARLSARQPGWEVITWVLVFSLPVCLPLWLWLMPPLVLEEIAAPAFWSFLYVALFSQFIGFFFWNTGLVMGGIARVSQVQLLQTFFTLAIAAVLNGEAITPGTLAVAVVIVVLVAVSRRV